MSQSASYGTNSAINRGVKQQQQQQHITQSQQTRVQNIDMLSYNNGNNNNGNSNITVVAETGGNTFAIANSTTMDQTTSITNQNTNTGAIPKEKPGKNAKQQQPRKPPPTIDTFWPTVLQEVQNAVVDSKHQSLPLARIKKIMKLDENAKMIAAEAPTLFAKACEFFIQELTMRAWIHTDESKRRTLQRSDIAQAIANYDQFDFLIDIVPREDIKPPNHRRHHNESTTSANNTASTTNSPAPSNSSMTTNVSNMVTGEILNVSGLPVENISGAAVATALPTTATITGNLNQTQPQMLTTASTTTNHPTPQLQIIQQTAHPQQHLQYFITLPGQQTGQAQLVHQLQLQQQQQQHINNGLAAGTPLTAAGLNLVAQQPQQLILTAANPNAAQAANVVQHQQQAALLQNIAQHQQQQQQAQQQQQHPQQQVQLLQQVMLTPSGELTNMPIAINANQLNLLRLQMQHQQQQQQQQQQHHQQQVIIPTHLLTAQQILQLQAQAQNQAQANNAATTHIVHHQPHITQHQQQQHHHQQQQQQAQHHPQTTTSTNNIYINSNSVAANQATSAAASMVSTDRNMGSTFRNNC